MSALLTPEGLLLPNVTPLPIVGPKEARHRVGQCCELEAFQESLGGYCGDPLCEAAEASGTLMMRDSRSGWRWLHFESAPPEAVQETLFQDGWRPSYKRSEEGERNVWRKNERHALPPSRIPYAYAGYCDYSDERPERLAERAQKKGALANGLHQRSNALVEHIPMGQPILVGHHSEKRHRRTLARSRALMSAACEMSDYAESLADRAKSSERHHARQDSAPGLARRIKTLETEERKLVRGESAWSRTEAGRVRWEFVLSEVREDLATARAKLAAHGERPTAKPGDIARVRGWRVVILKVNPKTYQCMLLNAGPAGDVLPYEKEELTAVERESAISAQEAKRLFSLRLPERRTWLTNNYELVSATLKPAKTDSGASEAAAEAHA